MTAIRFWRARKFRRNMNVWSVTAHSKLRQQNDMVFNNKYTIKCKDLKNKIAYSDLYSYDHSY